MNYNECKTIWQKNKEIEYFFIHMFTKHRFTQHYVKPFDSIKDKKNDWIYHNINYYWRKDIKFVKDDEADEEKIAHGFDNTNPNHDIDLLINDKNNF